MGVWVQRVILEEENSNVENFLLSPTTTINYNNITSIFIIKRIFLILIKKIRKLETKAKYKEAEKKETTNWGKKKRQNSCIDLNKFELLLKTPQNSYSVYGEYK